MNYDISLTKKARKFISSQPPKRQAQLLKAICKLPDIGDIKPIKGKNDMYRLRVSDYRVIYTWHRNTLTITVVNADSRGQVY
jgi:mRNA interferase RelE/StbE